MLRGKKGFDRIVYAFKNVLTSPVTWLFSDLGTKGMYLLKLQFTSVADSREALIPDPLAQHFPQQITCSPKLLNDIQVKRPPLKPSNGDTKVYAGDFEDFAFETLEWLSLVSLESPRINSDDKVDSFLSRYRPPESSSTVETLVKVTWEGFLAPSWAHKTLIEALASAPQGAWFSLYVGGFSEEWSGDGRNCTILKVPGAPNEYLLWEVL